MTTFIAVSRVVMLWGLCDYSVIMLGNYLIPQLARNWAAMNTLQTLSTFIIGLVMWPFALIPILMIWVNGKRG